MSLKRSLTKPVLDQFHQCLFVSASLSAPVVAVPVVAVPVVAAPVVAAPVIATSVDGITSLLILASMVDESTALANRFHGHNVQITRPSNNPNGICTGVNQPRK